MAPVVTERWGLEDETGMVEVTTVRKDLVGVGTYCTGRISAGDEGGGAAENVSARGEGLRAFPFSFQTIVYIVKKIIQNKLLIV